MLPATTNNAFVFSLVGARLTIDGALSYARSALKWDADYAAPLADLIEAGLIRLWSVDFLLESELQEALQALFPEVQPFLQIGERLEVRLLLRRARGRRLGRRRTARIRLARTRLLPSHVGSPLWRRWWGLLRTGQIESIGLNWSRRHPGAMTLVPYRRLRDLEVVAAHELGHLLGIGDSYGAFYRFFDAVPGSGNTRMRDNGPLSQRELAMILTAQRTNKMQYFPRRFRWSTVRQGFRSEVRRMERRLESWRQKRRRR